jgi:hypothetical protein
MMEWGLRAKRRAWDAWSAWSEDAMGSRMEGRGEDALETRMGGKPREALRAVQAHFSVTASVIPSAPLHGRMKVSHRWHWTTSTWH